MKNFKRIALGLVVAAMAISFSAFTNVKRVNSNFYVYSSSSHLQGDIQNFNNYIATSSDPCSGATTNVCGVTLPTAQPVNSKPISSEFDDESANLWDSQTAHAPQDGNIDMKP
ncbi:hypothetical protein SNE25_04730 [Mucilaginibacter sabulilitoris]|uniref:Uncharacterized protein n=1 Tax=Mucilaginibacter sabulilitoris TaxID=1173583 RepID=A0ABZ0TNV5_9SPHI|nr:hypothetical protein [Mucilaginibacter sabulilitoris]WPU94826.1 hypothetical protein SNE25_04730 [Mucilaginibacter sabulilitoris]